MLVPRPDRKARLSNSGLDPGPVPPPSINRMSRLLAALAAAAGLALLPLGVAALTSSPDDQFFRAGDQWALSGNASSTDAPPAWCATTGAGVLIADIDTGADFSHPDLTGKLLRGANFTSGNANPGPDPQPDSAPVDDDYGHGTLTAGIMVANTNNGIGMAAEAPGARALVVKVFSNKGGANGYSAYESDVAAGIYWSVEHGARVVNLSLGPTIPSILPGITGDPIPAAVQWAWNQGVAVAIAAGNGFADSGVTPPGTPANYPQLGPYALVVGAMGPGGTRAGYSQSGTGVNIFAPGGDGPGGDPHLDVLSTAMPPSAALGANFASGPGGDYGAYDGTSFATPYASGTLALLMARGLDAHQAHDRILGTARSVGGFRVLDAAAAVGGCSVAAGGTGGGGSTSRPVAGTQAAAASPHAPAASPSSSPAGTLRDAAGPASVKEQAAATTARGGGFAPWLLALVVAAVAAGAGAGWYVWKRE